LKDRRDFCHSDLIYLLDLLDPSERGQNLKDEEFGIAMKILSKKILKNPVFVGRESQVNLA